MGPAAAAITVVVLALTCASPASAAPWSAPRALTTAGSALPPAVAVARDGRVAALYVRFASGTSRLELRRGSADGLSRPILIDRAVRRGLDSPALTFGGDRTLTAWRREQGRADAIGFASVSGSDVAARPRFMTSGTTAYFPRLVGPSLLTWHSQPQGYVRQIEAGHLGVTDRLPARALFGTAMVVDAGGPFAATSDCGT